MNLKNLRIKHIAIFIIFIITLYIDYNILYVYDYETHPEYIFTILGIGLTIFLFITIARILDDSWDDRLF